MQLLSHADKLLCAFHPVRFPLSADLPAGMVRVRPQREPYELRAIYDRHPARRDYLKAVSAAAQIHRVPESEVIRFLSDRYLSASLPTKPSAAQGLAKHSRWKRLGRTPVA